MPVIAAIDIGSNAFRMVVGRSDGKGSLDIMENLRLPVRLGKDAFSSGFLTPVTMQKAVDAFMHFRNVAEMLGVAQCKAVATSAMREARNGQELIDRIARETGIQLEIISGQEEARLIHLAIRNRLDIQAKTSLLIDIGGGSVEVLLASGNNILASESYDLGTVRLLNRVESGGDKATPADRILREYAEAARRSIDREIGTDRIDICVGTGGNLEELGRLRKHLLHKPHSDLITLMDLNEIITILKGMSVEQRMTSLGLHPDRADVILPAAIVLQMIAEEAHIRKILIPGVGLKDGVLYDMLPRLALPALPRQTQVLASIERMGRKFAYDGRHAAATAFLAGRIFDQCLSLHHLTERERLLLTVAASLHDIGHYINTIGHEKHGYYLLMNHPFIGLSDQERSLAATMIAYHRKGMPSVFDDPMSTLPENERGVVIKLTAILRIADALDTAHKGRVSDVLLEPERDGCWLLHLVGQEAGLLETWAFEKRKALFEDTFKVTLRLEGE